MINNRSNNEKLNESREAVNDRVRKYRMLGKSKGRTWNGLRRFRTI